MSFDDLGLGPEILKAVNEAGYSEPTPIQKQAIPVALMGRDVLGIAQTGTGKTASFTLPMIEILGTGRARARMPRSLIIAPTRELAAQVAENFDKYGKYHKLSMALLMGGTSFNEQSKLLDKGVDVLIATPGRLLDLFERGKILLNDVKVLVIDEADRMLDMGFIPDVERIVGLLPTIRQTLFFSATMAPEIKRLADAFLMNPKEIRVAAAASPAETVEQRLTIVGGRDKRKALRALLDSHEVKNAFIFCNRKRDVSTLCQSLTRHGYSAVQMHGDMAQSQRMETLERFKSGDVSLMVCSDVAARGIDVSNVSHVFNFDVPIHSEDYVHRIGRTGRAGKTGQAFSLASPGDSRFVEAIEKLIGKPIERLEIDGLTVSLDEEDGAEGGRGGRSRGGRGRRSKSSDKPAKEEKPQAESADTQKEETAPEQPQQTEEAQEQDKSNGRSGRGRRNEGQKRDRRPRRGRYDSQAEIGLMEHADDVLGFGDHVPAFFDVDSEEEAKKAEKKKAAAAKRAAKKPAAKKTATKRKTTTKAKEDTPEATEAQEAEATASEDPAVTASEDEDAKPAKKPTRKRAPRKTTGTKTTRTRKKKADAEAAAEPDAPNADAPVADAPQEDAPAPEAQPEEEAV